jgi:hypothetical protein
MLYDDYNLSNCAQLILMQAIKVKALIAMALASAGLV